MQDFLRQPEHNILSFEVLIGHVSVQCSIVINLMLK